MTNSAIIMDKKQKNIKVEGEELELNNEEATQHEADTQKEVEDQTKRRLLQRKNMTPFDSCTG